MERRPERPLREQIARRAFAEFYLPGLALGGLAGGTTERDAEEAWRQPLLARFVRKALAHADDVLRMVQAAEALTREQQEREAQQIAELERHARERPSSSPWSFAA